MARFLLIVTLGLGIALMHALGHPAEHDCPAGLVYAHGSATPAHDPGPRALVSATEGGSAPMLVMYAAAPAPAMLVSLATMTGGPGGQGDCGDPTAICLAVLTLGGFLLVLAALRWRRVPVTALPSAEGGAWRPGMLDPPWGAGLVLARVSVLRI